jgi:hypothetical protein
MYFMKTYKVEGFPDYSWICFMNRKHIKDMIDLINMKVKEVDDIKDLIALKEKEVGNLKELNDLKDYSRKLDKMLIGNLEEIKELVVKQLGEKTDLLTDMLEDMLEDMLGEAV